MSSRQVPVPSGAQASAAVKRGGFTQDRVKYPKSWNDLTGLAQTGAEARRARRSKYLIAADLTFSASCSGSCLGKGFRNVADNNIYYWLALTRVDGLGARGAHKLVEQLGSPAAVYHASLTELEGCGLQARLAQAIFAQAGLKEAEAQVQAAAKAECRVLTFESESYPPLLKQIADPPLVLYVKGDVDVLSRYAVALVGTRRPTAYGSAVAQRLARELAQRQLVIVSGMARGIDSAGHRGALEGQGKTVAVLGSGLNVIYPRENKRLAEQIAVAGALVSEFPLGTAPTPENFPIRNRIISGMALGTIIVEAAEYSGSLITARLALEQNREVFAVPGNITSPQSFGPNHLIKQGAKLVDQWIDVVEEFPASVRKQLFPDSEASEGAAAVIRPAALFEQSLTPDQKAVFEALRVDEAIFVDAICEAVSVPQPRVLSALLELEMNGLIRQLPGKNFIRRL
jgi:DNA processing protein